MELLISTVNDEKIAFYLDNIREVMEKIELEEVANSPEFMEGIFNYRDSVIPVYSLRKILQMSEPVKISKRSQKIIIYMLNGKNFGVIVDDIDKIVSVGSEQIRTSDMIEKNQLINSNRIIDYERKVILIVEFNETILTHFDSFSKV